MMRNMDRTCFFEDGIRKIGESILQFVELISKLNRYELQISKTGKVFLPKLDLVFLDFVLVYSEDKPRSAAQVVRLRKTLLIREATEKLKVVRGREKFLKGLKDKGVDIEEVDHTKSISSQFLF